MRRSRGSSNPSSGASPPSSRPDSIKAAVAGYTKANDKATAEELAAVAAANAGDAAKLRTLLRLSNAANLATWPWAKSIGATGCYIP